MQSVIKKIYMTCRLLPLLEEESIARTCFWVKEVCNIVVFVFVNLVPLVMLPFYPQTLNNVLNLSRHEEKANELNTMGLLPFTPELLWALFNSNVRSTPCHNNIALFSDLHMLTNLPLGRQPREGLN